MTAREWKELDALAAEPDPPVIRRGRGPDKCPRVAHGSRKRARLEALAADMRARYELYRRLKQ